jgi:hypothetical protein
VGSRDRQMVVDGQLRQKWEALSKKKHTKRKKKGLDCSSSGRVFDFKLQLSTTKKTYKRILFPLLDGFGTIWSKINKP